MKKLLTFAGSIVLGCGLVSVAASAGSPAPAGSRTTERVSVSSSGAEGNLPSYPQGISADGRYVVFSSGSANLVRGDTNRRQDVFVHDRKTGRTTRVSVSSSGRQGKAGRDPFGGSVGEGISANGRYVVFRSDAANLVARDTNGVEDIFVRDRRTGRTARVSVDAAGRQANGSSGFAVISANGRYVAFDSQASNLVSGDTNGFTDVFVRDRAKGTTQRVSLGRGGKQARCSVGSCESWFPAISADGRYVAFTSGASNLVPGDTNRLADVFVRDRATGRTRRVSLSSRGRQGTGKRYSNGSNAPAISADGRYVAFHSDMSNLVPGDTNRTFDIFVHDRVTGKTERVSVSSHGVQANGENIGAPSISAGGRYVAYSSLASNLVPGDTNDITDAFVRDRRTHRTMLVSVSSSGEQGTDASWPNGAPAFSAGNRFLALASWAGNLVPGDTNGTADAFVRDLRGILPAEHLTMSVPRQEGSSTPAAAPGQHEPVLWGHVKSLSRNGSRFEMRFDPALWLTGVTANRAAAQDGREVSNDYYVVDETHRLLTYVVLPTARATVLTRGIRPLRVPVSELAQIVKGRNPRHRPLFDRRNSFGFWIRVGHRYPNPVLTIDQQYQP
jgi:Tol biopolymer transport system component